MAAERVRVEEVTTVSYGGGRDLLVPWPLSWSAVWVGTLSAIALALVFGLVAIAVGAHRVGQPFGTWREVSFVALVFSVFGSFLAFALGGWVAAKVAGLRRSETAMLHGAIVWIVAVPILVVLASIGRGVLLRRLVRRPRRTPARRGGPGPGGPAGSGGGDGGPQRRPGRADRPVARS